MAAESKVEETRRAYADIMLNMAQESAARVLAAERRAAALAGRMAAVKEDGVAALLRLKAIMESRIREVESQSLAHIKKTKELQEQLHGAQGTVASLQVELQRANTELEQTRKALVDERINRLHTYDKIESNSSSRSKRHLQNRLSSKKRFTSNDACRARTNSKESGAVENLENLYRSGSDLTSFMARNKKSELYRNGCTQRIRALKQRNPSADTSLVQNNKQDSELNSCPKTGRKDTNKNPCSTRSIMEQILQTKFLSHCKRKRGRRSRPNYKHEDSGELGQSEYKSSEMSDGNGCLLLLQALEQDLSPRKVSAGHGSEGLTDRKDGLLMGGKDADLNLCNEDILAVSNMQMRRRKRSKTIRVFEDGCSESKCALESVNALKGSAVENSMLDSEKRSDTHTPPRINSPVLQCTAENLCHQAVAASTCQVKSENSPPLVLQSTQTGNRDEGNLRVELPECSTQQNNLSVCAERNVDDSSILASDKSGALIVNSVDKEKQKTSSRVPIQAEGARCIKYTFNRRKRKGVSLESTTQDAVPEKSSSSVCSVVKREPQEMPEGQDLLIESPEGENQLVHIAQHLILLSEMKC